MEDLSPRKSDLEPIEIASIDEIRALQLDGLNWSIRHAYDNVSMYRRRIDKAGVHPDDVQELSDLGKLPFTEKNDLRDNYPFGMFAVPRSEIARVHASSGTTGKATVVGYTRNDIDLWADMLARSLRSAGGGHGAQCVRIRPVHRRAWRALRNRTPRCDRCPDGRRPNRKADRSHHRLQT